MQAKRSRRAGGMICACLWPLLTVADRCWQLLAVAVALTADGLQSAAKLERHEPRMPIRMGRACLRPLLTVADRCWPLLAVAADGLQGDRCYGFTRNRRRRRRALK